MDETCESLLSHLISSYNEGHYRYVSQYRDFSAVLGYMIITVVFIAPIAILFAWLLGKENLIENMVPAIWILGPYVIFEACFYYAVIKSKKRLNELKALLEYGGFRICRSKYNEHVVIVGASKVKESYIIVDPFHNIDFRKYNKLFEI